MLQDKKRKLSIYSYIAHKRIKRQLKKLANRVHPEVIKMNHDEDYDSHIVDDMPLTINRDPEPNTHLEQHA